MKYVQEWDKFQNPQNIAIGIDIVTNNNDRWKLCSLMAIVSRIVNQ